jgi:hypothetical protein
MKITPEVVVWPLILFFAPIKGIVFLMIALIITDTVTGIWKSKKLGIPITSRGLSAMISKVLLYCGGVMMIFSVDRLILNDLMMQFFTVDLMMTKILSMIFAFVEVVSINENWKAVHGFDILEHAKKLTKRAKVIKKELDDFKN